MQIYLFNTNVKARLLFLKQQSSHIYFDFQNQYHCYKGLKNKTNKYILIVKRVFHTLRLELSVCLKMKF